MIYTTEVSLYFQKKDLSYFELSCTNTTPLSHTISEILTYITVKTIGPTVLVEWKNE